MTLNTIVSNSNYVTDEEIESSNIVGMANQAIAEVNSKCETNLPLFVSENLSAKPYNAVSSTWILRLVEPYISYAIAANDTDSNVRDFHYNRFLQAVSEFKDNGIDYILKKDPETGEDTGYAGKADSTMINVDISDVHFHWNGWC